MVKLQANFGIPPDCSYLQNLILTQLFPGIIWNVPRHIPPGRILNVNRLFSQAKNGQIRVKPVWEMS